MARVAAILDFSQVRLVSTTGMATRGRVFWLRPVRHQMSAGRSRRFGLMVCYPNLILRALNETHIYSNTENP